MATRNADNFNNPIAPLNGGTGFTSTTAYGTMCWGSSNSSPLQAAATGTSGQVLFSNGPSGVPSYQTLIPGAITVIQSQTVSGAAGVTFSSGITATYSTYFLVISGLVQGDGGLIPYGIQLSTDGGSTWSTTGYQSGLNGFTYNSATWSNFNSTASLYGWIDNTDVFVSYGSAVIWLFNMTNGARVSMVGTSCGSYSSAQYSYYQGGQSAVTNANAIRLVSIPTSGSGLFAGTFTLCGVKES